MTQPSRKKLSAVFWFGTFALGALGIGCGEESRPATFSYIAPVLLAPNCATSSCHGPGAAVAGLDFSTVDASFKGLRGQRLPKRGKAETADDERFRVMVVPGNPSESRLVNMLRARGANRMPPNRPMAEADIRLIEEWIASGANND